MKNKILYPCPCCGEKTLFSLDNYEICTACNWEDDPVQSKDSSFSGGANALSLLDARKKHIEKK